MYLGDVDDGSGTVLLGASSLEYNRCNRARTDPFQCHSAVVIFEFLLSFDSN